MTNFVFDKMVRLIAINVTDFCMGVCDGSDLQTPNFNQIFIEKNDS